MYQINALHLIDSYESFALHLTTYAIGVGATWPFVTAPEFATEASNTMLKTGANTLSIVPLVLPENLGAWNDYSVNNSEEWLQGVAEYMGYNETKVEQEPIKPFIWGDKIYLPQAARPLTEPVKGKKYFAPLWQSLQAQWPGNAVNYDSYQFNSFPSVYERMITQQGPILSEPNNLDRLGESGPESYMIIPVYDDVKDEDKKEIVAAVISILPWRNYFVDLVPEGIDGITLVIDNECAESSFTYEINGPEVDFLGLEDHHDLTYDEYEVASDFTTFTDIPKECQTTLHLYPTETFHSAYITNKPIIYTFASVLIFFVTALVFVVYDCLVEKRQDKVMTSATRSNAIVSSLFPEQVRERLMDDAAGGSNKKDETGASRLVPFGMTDKSAWKTDNVNGQASSSSLTSPSGHFTSKPIADLFPSASVMFADIAGFTAWSSVREPTQVFTLLEGIYNAFDRIAKKKKVFKVETIGDCYGKHLQMKGQLVLSIIVPNTILRSCIIRLFIQLRLVDYLKQEMTTQSSWRASHVTVSKRWDQLCRNSKHN